MNLASLLAAIGAGFIGLAVGAALQRWGDADRATHGHKDYLQSVGRGNYRTTRSELHEQIADQWSGW